MSSKQMFKGALLLTLSSLISKVLSAGYRIPLQNITGDKGFYIYQQIYPFLGMALILALYGYPAAISMLVAERKERGDSISFSSFYIPIFALLVVFNATLFYVLFAEAHTLAAWMGDENLVLPLKVASFTFLVIPVTSLFRGVFQGINNMQPTAISQIIEQVFRVTIILFSALFLVNQGRDVYEIGIGAAFASLIGTGMAALFLLVVWARRIPLKKSSSIIKWGQYVKTIFFHGIFICLNYMMLLLFQMADAFTLVPGLMDFGFVKQEAMSWKGVFDRGQPLIQLGTVLGSSIALALIPTVTKKRLERAPGMLYKHIHSAWKFSFYISAGATAGMVSIFPFMNQLLFEDNSGTFSLRILAVAVFVTSLAITVSSILQGLGKVRITAGFVVIGVLVKWVLNGFLVPGFGITGSAAATVISVTIVLFLNIFQLKRTAPPVKLARVNWYALIVALGSMLVFLAGMGLMAEYLFTITARWEYLVYTLFVSVTGGIIYLGAVVRCNGFTKEELEYFPYGHVLVKISDRRK